MWLRPLVSSTYRRSLPPGGVQKQRFHCTNSKYVPCVNSAESNTVTMYGRGFDKFNSAESHSVRCGFKFNNTYRQGML